MTEVCKRSVCPEGPETRGWTLAFITESKTARRFSNRERSGCTNSDSGMGEQNPMVCLHSKHSHPWVAVSWGCAVRVSLQNSAVETFCACGNANWEIKNTTTLKVATSFFRLVPLATRGPFHKAGSTNSASHPELWVDLLWDRKLWVFSSGTADLS